MEENKDNVIDINKSELWKQLKNDTDCKPASIKFEAIDVDDGRASCFVEGHLPNGVSNFQHAALLSGIFEWMCDYVGEIEDFKDFAIKDVPLDAILEGQKKLGIAFQKMLIRCKPTDFDIKEITKEEEEDD